MRELWGLAPKRLEHLRLRGAVRHMVLAADHMGHAKVDVIDHARQQIEPAAVLAPDDGVAQQPGVETLLSTNQVGEDDRLVMIEPEAPVRCACCRRAAGPSATARSG